MEKQQELERATGELFSDLWKPYDDSLFAESVELFVKRMRLARFDTDWFKGKTCLDAGCGGGRNSIAMAKLGAGKVVGIDVGKDGLVDARRRAKALPDVTFEHASILEIPFKDETFDMVWCAGVLMITADEERALDELTRVTKSGGQLYLLVYATEGMRWPLIQLLRPLACQLGQPAVERAIELADLPANKRRTFLDDLFCPRLDFYHWDRLDRMLQRRGFRTITRWGSECRLDHEADLRSYREDLEALAAIFAAGDCEEFGTDRMLFQAGYQAARATIDSIRSAEAKVEEGAMPVDTAMQHIIGQGHHRVLAVKG